METCFMNCSFELICHCPKICFVIFIRNDQMVINSQSESIQSSGGIFVLNGRGEIALSQISIAMAL